MLERTLQSLAFADAWGRQMRFIVGPRQTGKTTLAKMRLARAGCERLYYLWDSRAVRDRYREDELFITADLSGVADPLPWACFDEIHKMPKWKNILKSIFDQTQDQVRLMVTGSAKLNVLKSAGDSLAGRYFTFHLMPLTLREAAGRGAAAGATTVPDSALDFVARRLDATAAGQDVLEALLQFGGFPEPFLAQSKAFHRKWATDYVDTVIREDIAQLTRIIDRETIHHLYSLLPEMVGSPISEAALAGHLQSSPPTVKNYLRRLADFYLAFPVPPYSRNIKRAILKARKCYLYDWSRVADPAARFENYIACELNATLHLWSDASGTPFDLFHIRDKMKRETDFLIVRDGQPWLLVEAKLTDRAVDHQHLVHRQALGDIPLVQVCERPGIATQQRQGVFRLSAARLFGG
jgi:predicted AAA+ superfamily ATPase